MSQRHMVRLFICLGLLLGVGVGYRWWYVAGLRTPAKWEATAAAAVAHAAPSGAPPPAQVPAPPSAPAQEAIREPAVEPAPPRPAPDGDSAGAPVAPRGQGEQVNGAHCAPGLLPLNTATRADLEALPGIGAVIANAILLERAARGGFFTRVEDLLAVKGIGPARFARLAPLVCVGPLPAP